jgi:lipopolysaccharide transport system ATP-binding protein
LGERNDYGSLRDSLMALLRAPIRPFSGRKAARDAGRNAMIWALKDVSFDVQHGEIVGVIGRNGSGKSTLLKILSRITEPTSGLAEIEGRVGALLEVGTGFHPDLTGRENVFVNGAILGMKRVEIQRKFDEIVAFAGIERFVDTPAKFYSSGMQMRLAFSVAAHLEPNILLVDEVLAVGDVAFQKKCLGKMDDVTREGRTVLFVSHQMNQIRRLCRRCIWLNDGRLVRVGPTAEVCNEYDASLAVATRGSGPAVRSQQTRFVGWTLGTSDWNHHVLDTLGPVVVRFLLRVGREVRNGHHSVVLYDGDGQLMWGTGTDNVKLDAGLHEIRYSFDVLPLRPGPYRWLVTLSDNLAMVDSYDGVPTMSVETPPLGHRQDEWAGILNLPHTLAMAPVADAVDLSDTTPAEAAPAAR